MCCCVFGIPSRLDAPGRLALAVRPLHMRYLLLLLFCLLAGCASHDWSDASERRAYGAIVERSPSFERARAIDSSRVIWFVEQPDDPPQIYVGFDMGTHTCRSATLRIREHVVEKQEMREDGELIWIVDR